VVTSAGIYGEVVGVEETTLTLRVAEGVEMRFVRSAVSTVLSPNEADAAGKPAEKPAEKWSNRPGRRK
jgi:preprotein translocase subunit YajC